MVEQLNIYRVQFVGMWPVGNCLILAAHNIDEATEMAKQTITHTDKFEVTEVVIDKPVIIEYLSGDY